ncbi:nucleotidyltransferase family protein [Sphingomonas sp. LB2R24]|uniref:nucleotidyltransferase family protein n=1 Tax=Sphingomonas sorbitolis TaxID=3096165 RepID=UPI002FC7DEFD
MLRNRPDDRELTLLAACLCPLTLPDRVAGIARIAALPFDADRLVDLAHRHRVSGFVEEGLAAIGHALPDTAAALLARRAAASRMQSLRNAGEEIRVGKALAAAGIDAVFVKGSTLAIQAHHTLMLKTSWDVDVLIARGQLDAACETLTALGYRLSILGGITDPVHIRRYLAAHKESEWYHDERGTVVELHTELGDNRAAITTIGLDSPRMLVELMPGTSLATLAPAPLFAYLMFHGAKHLWARLKWLADVAALLHDADVETLYRETIVLGAGRCPGLAIVLAHELFGIPVPQALLEEIRRDPVTRRLVRFCYTAIMADEDAEGRLMRPMRELIAFERAQLWLVPGLAYRWGAVRSLLSRPNAVAHLQVPNWAVPAAILTGLPLRLLRRPARLRPQSAGKTAKTL